MVNVTVNAGWSIFTSEKKEKQLPDLNVDDVVNVDFKPVQKETTPPKHYTVTSLNNFMINPFRKETVKMMMKNIKYSCMY